jgi:transposase InsO family protein
MSMARLVVTAVRLERRTKTEVARDYGVSRQRVRELVRRFDAEGEAAFEPRSRRPRGSPLRTPGALEDEIVELRKHLADEGLDAGAHTIAYHLGKRHGASPSVATIWRILSRRGFVTPQPQKRPRSSFVRFAAEMPNERWQADITHWRLGGEREVEILNVIDDHSRLLVASDALVIFKAADVVASFHAAAAAHGFPAQMLTDNGAVFTAAPRGGRCAMELETAALGIAYRHSSPYHPQTCGKVERFHQTEKKWLAKQPAAGSVDELHGSRTGRLGPMEYDAAWWNEVERRLVAGAAQLNACGGQVPHQEPNVHAPGAWSPRLRAVPSSTPRRQELQSSDPVSHGYA